jgi:hypothetical protein
MTFTLLSHIPEGLRNDQLTRYAGLLRRHGADVDTLEHKLFEANAERCDPPLADVEVRTIARSVAKYPPHPVTEWKSPTRDLVEVARRRGYRLIGAVTRVDCSLFSVGLRKGGGAVRVELDSASGARCGCTWFSNPTNESNTCAHIEAVRAWVGIRYPLEVGTPTD